MPIFFGRKAEFVIGPRRSFSALDGIYVPSSVRSRCIRGRVSAPVGQLELRDLYLGTNDCQAILGGATDEQRGYALTEKETKFGLRIEESRGSDPDYAAWLKELTHALCLDQTLIPYKPDTEAPTPNLSVILLGSPGDIVSGSGFRRFQAPPPGLFPSTGHSVDVPADIATAQPRDKDAPKLVWPGGRRYNLDSEVDRWHEDRSRSTDT